ncbi:MAG: hypothetical protein AB8H86_14610 [Polyangiales bacterium]
MLTSLLFLSGVGGGCTKSPTACPELGSDESGLTAPARFVVGEASAWPAESRRRDEAALRSSLGERRALGWDVISRLVEDVPVAAPSGGPATLPRFQTWYGEEDLRRVVQHLHESGDDDYSNAALDEAFEWNRRAVLEFEGWPEERLAEFVDGASEGEGARGLGGIERVIYSPLAARHLLQSRHELAACAAPEPDANLPDGFRTAEQEESVWLDGCGSRRLGPYSVADGGSFVAESEGAVVLSVGGDECEGTTCRVMGPAEVYVDVRARERGRAQIQVRYDEPVALWTPCLIQEFPDGAVILKTEYRRVGFGFTVGAHDTSVTGVEAAFAEGESWTEGQDADPGEDSIFTLALPSGARYRLVAMHAMVKDLDHWIWSTMWWSDSPQADFGEDRPGALGAPWDQYKMCATTWFEEEDTDFTGVTEEIRAASTLRGSESWCSNPFIESGVGAAATNCIGCHQHAGTGASSEEILGGALIPGARPGRLQERNNFPTDYVFSVDVIDELIRALPQL